MKRKDIIEKLESAVEGLYIAAGEAEDEGVSEDTYVTIVDVAYDLKCLISDLS